MEKDIYLIRITVQDIHRLLEKLVEQQEANRACCRAVQQQPPSITPVELEEYLDKEQVKDYLDIRETTYYRWVKQGKLNPRGGKGQHRYYKQDIRELMERRKYRKRG